MTHRKIKRSRTQVVQKEVSNSIRSGSPKTAIRTAIRFVNSFLYRDCKEIFSLTLFIVSLVCREKAEERRLNSQKNKSRTSNVLFPNDDRHLRLIFFSLMAKHTLCDNKYIRSPPKLFFNCFLNDVPQAVIVVL